MILVGKLKEEELLEDIKVDGRVVMKRLLKKWNGRT
jgi:hypothetical protein